METQTFGSFCGELRIEVEGVIRSSSHRFEWGVDLSPE